MKKTTADKMPYDDLVHLIVKSSPVKVNLDQVRAVLKTLTSIVTSTVQEKQIVIPGLCSFALVEVAERVGFNPRTGEPMPIGAHSKLKITPVASLRKMEPVA